MPIVFNFDNKKLKKFGNAERHGNGLFDNALSFIKHIPTKEIYDTGMSIKNIVDDGKDIKKIDSAIHIIENDSELAKQFEAARARLGKKKGNGFVEVKI